MAGPLPTSNLQQFPWVATLSGAMEVPPVVSGGSGMAWLAFEPSVQNIQVIQVVNNILQVREAHIHLGRPGENGPIVLFLYGPSVPRDFLTPTVITNNTYTAANLTGPLRGMPLSALAREIMTGNAYVNVHTVAHPMGEIRGQIVRRP